MVFPRTAAKVNFTSSTQHLLLAFHHVHHLHQLHLHHIRRLYLLHLSYIPYITYIIYINFIYIIYSNFMCITYTICITNTSYRCSSCTCALQNSYNVIYSAPGSYTGVVTQELLHRSCYTGVVTKELLHRSAQVHLNAYKTPTGTSQALLNFSFLAAGAARPRPPKRDSLWRSSDSRTHKRVVKCLFFWCWSNPLRRSWVPDARTCGEMRIVCGFVLFVGCVGISNSQFHLSFWHAAIISCEQVATKISQLRCYTNFGHVRMTRQNRNFESVLQFNFQVVLKGCI